MLPKHGVWQSKPNSHVKAQVQRRTSPLLEFCRCSRVCDRDKSTVSGDGSLTIIGGRRSERCSRCTVYIFTTKRSYAEDSVSPTTRRNSGSRREPIPFGRRSA